MQYHALIITSHREYAQAMRHALLKGGDEQKRVDIELDPLRATQLGPQHYEWVLLDATLDGMDGVQLLLLIKQQAPASKYIIVSDSDNEITRAVAYQNGADFFLERPTKPEAFAPALQAIQGLLNESETTHIPKDAGQGTVVAISDIVQMRCLSGDSVLLMVRSQVQSGDIFIYRGDIFHAQYPGKSGEAALSDILQWDGGLVRIRVAKLTHIPPRTIETPYLELLKAVQKPVAKPEPRPTDGELFTVPGDPPTQTATLSVVKEAPPREDNPPVFFPNASVLTGGGETTLPRVNSHWMVNLSGDLLEGSQMSEPDRCAFITSFIYRKLADVAVALETDYFNHLTLLGPHLQQVLVADNIGVRHAVFDTAWTTEEMRVQYLKWCREQSF